MRREAVEAEAVDQQVGHVAAFVLSSHVAIELMVDDLQFIRGEGAGVLVSRAEARVIEQLFAPDVRADQRKVAPTYADIAGQPLLQRPQRALAGGGCSLGIDYHGSLLTRQQGIAFTRGGLAQDGIQPLAKSLAAVGIARKIGRDSLDQLGGTPGATVRGKECRPHLRQRAMRGRLQRIAAAAGDVLAGGDVRQAPAEASRAVRWLTVARCEPAR